MLSSATLVLFGALPPFVAAERVAQDVVADVQVRVTVNPTHRVIHVLNWHWISEVDFKLDDPGGDYRTFLDDVEAGQQEQVTVLLKLGVRQVHYEGLTEEIRLDYHRRVETLALMQQSAGNSPTQQLVAEFMRDHMLRLGAPGKA